jgi:hypothetical protein
MIIFEKDLSAEKTIITPVKNSKDLTGIPVNLWTSSKKVIIPSDKIKIILSIKIGQLFIICSYASLGALTYY